MTVNRESASAFAHRLGDLIAGDTDAPEVVHAPCFASEIDVKGRCQVEPTGSEAILIVRGPVENRRQAIRNLLAKLDSE